MPTFIPARGPTLHLVGVCVNRIGKEPTLLTDTRWLFASHQYIQKKLSIIVVLPSDTAYYVKSFKEISWRSWAVSGYNVDIVTNFWMFLLGEVISLSKATIPIGFMVNKEC